ncbi:GNAT family N-acetyltransferase [Thermoleptolyngbya sichuanensis XZ-Cy5]|uniref:GNAT family N-acetyltransferase n=1 Tax=Thermoleptolyngbya sichuanensis TaxID=2885951 RepID=UPI00240E6E04|nr:GNAT family N-acetyltransferase [Thermoleptolyngbya sichuanensis]MDG2615912.1 GNAT family N-acetyltransferase [Thermoleptolyngbya sichuanensis XZ-Cy5]
MLSQISPIEEKLEQKVEQKTQVPTELPQAPHATKPASALHPLPVRSAAARILDRAANPELIQIRHVQAGDIDKLHSLLTSPDVVYWTSKMPCVVAEEMREQLSNPPAGHYTLVATYNQSVAGSLGFSTCLQPRMRHMGHISTVAVHPNFRGYGVGTALVKAAIDLADQWFNLHRLDLMVYTDNDAAIALYKKFGFVTEGVLKDYAFRAGAYTDVQVMARFAKRGI